MDKLRRFINSLDTPDQFFFAQRCGTTIGYLRKKLSTGGNLGPEIVIAIERESRGEVRCEDLRPDIDWSAVRQGPRAARTRRNAA